MKRAHDVYKSDRSLPHIKLETSFCFSQVPPSYFNPIFYTKKELLTMDFICFATIITCLVALLFLHHPWRKRIQTNVKRPPEPSVAWPIIGHLHLFIRKRPVAHTLGSLADKTGPIFSIKLGLDRAIVISSREAVKNCFTTNDRAFASRAPSTTGEYLGYNYAAFGLAPYGPYWRDVRKIVTLELLSAKRLETLKHIRISEVEESMKELHLTFIRNNDSVNPLKVEISKWFEQLALNMIVKPISGKRYVNCLNGDEDEEAEHFRRLLKEFTYAASEFQVSDRIPIPLLRWLDLNGNVKNMKRISKEMDGVFQSWIDEHAKRRQEKENVEDQDFIDVMLSVIGDNLTHGYTRDTVIKATVMLIILASTDTSSVLLTWIMSLLLNHRNVMKRAQEEIDNNIGKNRWVEESDIKNLKYLQSIIKETLRLYPPGPLLVPHQAMDDCYVGDYIIPRGTHLLVNAWKLHRDPHIWAEPDKYDPERFLKKHDQVDVYGHQFEYIPFGAGRRSCPGATYAMRATHLTIARLLQGFNFSTPLNLPIDMKEGNGLLLNRENPLEVLISPRLPALRYGN